MLDKNTFVEGLNKLIVAYPSWGLKSDDNKTLRVWYNFFKHMDGERFNYMINSYIEHEPRYPTVAGLKKCDTIPRKSRDQIEHEKMLKEQGLL